MERERKVKGFIAHVVKKKDSLPNIMKRYGVTHAEPRACQLLRHGTQGKAGCCGLHSIVLQAARTQRRTEGAGGRSREKEGSVARVDVRKEPSRSRSPRPQLKKEAKTYHIVRKGEKLSDISEKYGVGVTHTAGDQQVKEGSDLPEHADRIGEPEEGQT